MTKKPLQQKAYELIKDRIINFEYQPGAFLNTVDLQDQMGISRTPIREALGRLEVENLVKFFPNKGFTVSDVSLSTISTIYETRILIEPHIVINYGGLVDVKELERLREIFRQGMAKADEAPNDYMAYDDELHALLRSPCPNIYIVQVLDQIAAQAQRVRIMSGYVGLKLKHLCKEHMEIVDAILEKNYPFAGKLMTSHLIRARKNAFLAPSLNK